MTELATVRFCAETEGYRLLRIPCIITPAENHILAVLEAREGCSDWAKIDLMLLASHDGGASFSRRILVEAEAGQTVNNPVLIDGGAGVVHFLYCVQYGVTELGGGVYYCRSNDGGETFSAARDITAMTLPEYRNAFATGPMHGIMAEDGVLYVPVWLVPKSAGRALQSHHPAELRLMFSPDGGEHWLLTEPVPEGEAPDPNETGVAQLDGERLLLNIRSGKRHCRCFSVYDIPSRTFSPIRCSEIPDPICCGAITRRGNTLFLCGCEDERERRNLVVRTSTDDGETWLPCLTVEPGRAGYPDISCSGDGKLYVIYETDGERTLVLKLYALPDKISREA